MAWLYVPGLEGLNLDSSSPSPDIVVWVTASGTPLQRPLSWPGWKARPWIKRLFGTISQPSQANSIAEQWISSQRGFRASRFPARVSVKGPTMSGGSGKILPEWFAKFDPVLCSWKTSQACLPTLEDTERSWVT